MGQINLYRIDPQKQQELIRELNKKLNRRNTVFISRQISEDISIEFGLTLFKSADVPRTSDLGWSWVLEAFGIESEQVVSNPKAVILIEVENSTYAVTFGHAFFLVDKYCDRDFGFNFCRRIPLKEIKTTALTTPNSKRNKTVNTYINYNQLEFDSGESFAKIKAKLNLDDDFTLFKPSLEVGSSIKFMADYDSLENIIDIIVYVENIIANNDEIYKIPVFTKVTDPLLTDALNMRLKQQAIDNPQQFNISELDIIGATEIFNRNDSEFLIKYKRFEKRVDSLSNETILSFCAENGLQFDQIVFDIKVYSLLDGETIKSDSILNLIDYTDDEERCLLSKGAWYRYNDDYINYLRDSINEIDVKHLSQFDFSKSSHNQFIETKYNLEKDKSEYVDKSEDSIKKLLKKKYYSERWYNLLRAENDGFQNFDRVEHRVEGADIELMDLYKDETMFAVKIGNSSAKLCYVVDQSLTSLIMYKHKKISGMPNIKNVAIWLILDRTNRLPILDNGKPDINALDMLMLKNRLDQWKKEVRLQGYTPIIYLNYVIE